MENELVLEDKTYKFPKLSFYRFDEYHIIVNRDTGGWLSFTDKEKEIFNLLYQGKSIFQVAETMETNLDLDLGLLGNVVVQIENSPIETGKTAQIIPVNEGAYLYLTMGCNLSCPTCFVKAGKPLTHELSLQQWVDSIDKLSEIGVRSITFTGGEPLLKQEFQQIVEYTKNKDISTKVLTNGLLWDRYEINWISRYIDEVQISIDGPTDKSNALIRGDKAFNKILTNLRKIALADVEITIAMTPTLDTLDEYAKHFIGFVKLLHETVSENIVIKVTSKLLKGRVVDSLSRPSEVKRYKTVVHDLLNTVYPDYTYINFANDFSDGFVKNNCGYGGLTIGADGSLFPCNRILEVEKFGNINNVSHKQLITLMKELNTVTSVDFIETCKTCDFKYICGGGCRLDDYVGMGFNEKELLKNIACGEKEKRHLLKLMALSKKYLFSDVEVTESLV